MQASVRVIVMMVFAVVAAPRARATEELRVVNDTKRVMRFSVWSYNVSRWVQSIGFKPGEAKSVYFNSGEDYYLRFRDSQGHRRDVGRFNITRVLSQNPGYELAIGQTVEAAAVEEVYYVWCRWHWTWHRKVRIIERPDPTPHFHAGFRPRSKGR